MHRTQRGWRKQEKLGTSLRRLRVVWLRTLALGVSSILRKTPQVPALHLGVVLVQNHCYSADE